MNKPMLTHRLFLWRDLPPLLVLFRSAHYYAVDAVDCVAKVLNHLL